MRISIATWLMVILCLGTGVFMVANRVQQSEKAIDQLQAGIAEEKENMRVLQADWTYLNSPGRLEKVAKQYFELAPGNGDQYAAVESIPMRAALDEQEQAAKAEAEALAQIEPGTPDSMLAESGSDVIGKELSDARGYNE